VKKILSNNIGFKLLALGLAFVTWLYVGEVTKEDSKETVLRKLLSPVSYVSKKLIIKPVFEGEVLPGYKILKSEIRITPDSIVVLGPSRILLDKDFIYTKPIDLKEYTQTKTTEVGLESVSRAIRSSKNKVQVYLPVEKLAQGKTRD